MNARIKEQIEQINSGIVPEGYQKTAFGIFPCDWETNKTLGDLGQFSKGKGIPGNKLTSEGVPCVGYGDIYMKYNYHFENAQSFVDEQTAAESQKIGKGTLLFTATGETAEEIGKCVCYNGEKDVYAGGDIITFVPYVLNSLFIAYQQYQSYALRQKASFGQGHSVVHIQKDRLEKLHIAFPKSTQEQARIAEILMQWDKAIEMQGKLGEAYQKLKKYCLNKMFPKKGSNVPEIRFPGFTAPWEQRKLGDMGKTFTGLSGKSSVDFGHGDGRFVTYMNVFTNAIANPEMVEPIEIDSKQSTVKYGDIFFTTSSETPEEVGMSSIWLENTPNTYLNSFCFGFRLQTDLDYVYMAYALRSDTFRTKIILLAQGISRYNISKNKVMDIDSVFPSIMEQKQIGEFFLNLDNIITLHQKKREKLVAQRKILQQYLLTGIVRV